MSFLAHFWCFVWGTPQEPFSLRVDSIGKKGFGVKASPRARLERQFKRYMFLGHDEIYWLLTNPLYLIMFLLAAGGGAGYYFQQVCFSACLCVHERSPNVLFCLCLRLRQVSASVTLFTFFPGSFSSWLGFFVWLLSLTPPAHTSASL